MYIKDVNILTEGNVILERENRKDIGAENAWLTDQHIFMKYSVPIVIKLEAPAFRKPLNQFQFAKQLYGLHHSIKIFQMIAAAQQR